MDIFHNSITFKSKRGLRFETPGIDTAMDVEFENLNFPNILYLSFTGFIFGKTKPKEWSVDYNDGKWYDQTSQGSLFNNIVVILVWTSWSSTRIENKIAHGNRLTLSRNKPRTM